jgi:predicted DNA-binding WGR domain protein
MSDTITVPATELHFAEGSSDKFYRGFTVGCVSVVQYGRSGTYGTFQRKSFDSPEAAAANTAKQASAKFKKGYEVVKTVELTFTSEPSDADLDAAMSGVSGTAAAPAEPKAPLERQSAVVNGDDDFTPDPEIFKEVLLRWEDVLDVHTVFRLTSAEREPVRPMLAQIAEADRIVDLLGSSKWATQLKFDGDRFVIEVVNGEVAVYGRNGQAKQRDVNANLLRPFRHLIEGRWVFDGEMVGRTLVLFDMIQAGAFVGPKDSFLARYAALDEIADVLFAEIDEIVVADLALNSDDKHGMLADAETNQREGIILRRIDAPYRPGRTEDMLKHKFVKEADVVVMEINRGGKDNCVVGLYDTAGNLVEVGQVTTIGKGSIEVGQVIEVRFLYVVDPDSPRLYQPRIMRVRTDKSAAECSMEQLAGAVANKAVR